MKKVFLASLLIASQVSMASILENTDPTLIVRAIKDSLATNDLTCLERVSQRTMNASSLRLDKLTEYSVEITEGVQPVLKFYENEDNYETTVLVTTNADFTVVTAIESEQYKLNIHREERNTGTIINPHYEVVTDVQKTLTEKLDCR